MKTEKQDARRKVTDSQIKDIILRWGRGERISMIAKDFNLTEGGIRRIIHKYGGNIN